MARSIISILLIAASVAIFLVWTQPRIGSIQDLQAEEKELQEILINVQELNQIKDNLLSVYQSYDDRDTSRLEKFLPDNIDNVKLILEVQQLADSRQVRVQSIQANQPGTSGTGGTEDILPYGTVELNFSLIGTYEDFVPFIRDLERSLRIISIEHVSFNSSDVVDTYQFQVEIITHWLR